MLTSADLAAYLQPRLPTDPSAPEQVLAQSLAWSVLDSGPADRWRRRPSLSHDGTAAQLSVKMSGAAPDGSVDSRTDTVRLLVEPGSLRMTVAQQVSHGLTALDDMLGRLGWRSAADDINTITAAVLPEAAEQTRGWWGGMWLGGSFSPAAAVTAACRSPVELRIYLNLRHGDADRRWNRVSGLFERFRQHGASAAFLPWLSSAAGRAIPVGLGIVVTAGRVAALRLYVVVPTDGAAFVPTCGSMDAPAFDELLRVCSRFTRLFGPLPPDMVTIGVDFLRSPDGEFADRIGRVKVELSCQGLHRDLRGPILGWTDSVLADWTLDEAPLHRFTDDMNSSWGGYDIEHISLGFAPHPVHVTVYAKPA